MFIERCRCGGRDRLVLERPDWGAKPPLTSSGVVCSLVRARRVRGVRRGVVVGGWAGLWLARKPSRIDRVAPSGGVSRREVRTRNLRTQQRALKVNAQSALFGVPNQPRSGVWAVLQSVFPDGFL